MQIFTKNNSIKKALHFCKASNHQFKSTLWIGKYSNYFSIFLFQTFKPIAVAEYPKNPNTISVEIP